MTDFVHLGLKRTEDVDLLTPLGNFITSILGKSFTDDLPLSQFAKLRSKLTSLEITDIGSVNQLGKYLFNLQSLSQRIPLGSLNVEFEWSDTLNKDKMVKSKSISFEKVNLMFQLASLYSYAGAMQAMDLNWKQCIVYFNQSSGILNKISEVYHHMDKCKDLQVDNLKGLSKMMLSQALECFLWNYIHTNGDGVKNSLLARLAQGIVLNLTQCVQLMNNSEDDDLAIKRDYFQTFALVKNAENYYSQDKVGYAIVSLKIALDSCPPSNKSQSPNLNVMIDELNQEIKSKVKSWEKDNDLIYHDKLPDKINIPLIKPMEGTKPVSYEDIINSFECDDLFKQIVPMEAHESLSIYSERQADLIRKVSENVQISNEELTSTYEFLNLPQSVHDVQNLLKSEPENLDNQRDYSRVLAMSHDISSSPNFINEFTNLNQTKQKITQLLSHGNQLANLMLGHPEVKMIKDQIDQIGKLIYDTQVSDDKLKSMYDSYDRDIGIMQRGTASVDSWLQETPDKQDVGSLTVNLLDLDLSSPASKKGNEQELIDKIWSCRASLDGLLKQRNTNLEEMKSRMHNEDISSLLLANKGCSGAQLDKLFDTQLSKYNPYIQKIDLLTDQQDDLINQLKSHLTELLSMDVINKKVQEKTEQRKTIQAKIASLVRAFDAWKVSSKGVKEGNAFYDQLLGKVNGMVARLDQLQQQQQQQQHQPPQYGSGQFRY